MTKGATRLSPFSIFRRTKGATFSSSIKNGTVARHVFTRGE